jgi:hypothetical protein
VPDEIPSFGAVEIALLAAIAKIQQSKTATECKANSGPQWLRRERSLLSARDGLDLIMAA